MKTLTLLLGPQGSGKTTYAREHFPEVLRISQDDQGRGGHVRVFETAIAEGKDILVDRINHQREQRLRYVLPARDAGYHIGYLWFDADSHTCLQRLAHRDRHPTVDVAQTDHEKMLDNYFHHFERPEPSEYDHLEIIPVHRRAEIVDLRETLCQAARVWIVGDVHGCCEELLQLLDRGGYQPAEDFLLFTGDLVNRGHQVAETLRFVAQCPKARVVKGNHDDRLTRALAGLRLERSNGLDRSLESLAPWNRDEREACQQWMQDWPYILRLPDFSGKPFYLVHAGVCGLRPMEDQYQHDCLYARYLPGTASPNHPRGRLWYETLPGDRVIAFGHIPHRDPKPARDVFALDGGVVRGGELRALVWTPGRYSVGPDGTKAEAHIISVPGRFEHAGAHPFL